ncbi:MAG: bifunctional hydroxymethylpyrimidine kinase/phosphomethylpyrimidine kinase [Brevinematales bacterium]|nr:bifunctional hydroxymethylpyrimidine kinase/phosphomethylpyrimidine kinase [Brevinematales bacterium]
MKKERVALTIAGSDSGGGAGIQIDLKTFNEIGVFGASVITSITAQNTLGVQGIYDVSPEFVQKQLESIFSDINIQYAKTGMLSNAGIIETVSNYIKKVLNEGKLKGLVIDPVMRAKGGDPLLRDDATEMLVKKLLPLSLVITPNIPEAELLSGISIKTIKDMKESAIRIHKMGPQYVVVKGGHLKGDYAIDVVYNGENFSILKSKKKFKGDVHGTGCCFSASITAYLTKGYGILEAIRKAKRFVSKAIKDGIYIGNGFRVLKTY